MDTTQILSDLRDELDRVTRAIAALESLNGTGTPAVRRGRPKGGATFEFRADAPRRGRRRISAAGRKRIAEAKRLWWAQHKKGAVPAKKAAPARHMSAATKKRLSALAKARWAARKKATAA
jgi:hypothetical protein